MSAFSSLFGPEERGGGAWKTALQLFDDMLIVRALILRNLKNKYRHNPLGLMLEFLQPVIVCTVHYWYFSLTGRNVPDNVYLIFTIGGFSIWFCFVAAYMGTLGGSMGHQGALNIPGVTVMHMNLAKAIWPFLLFLLFVYGVSWPGKWMGAPIGPPDFLISCATYGMASGLGFAFGLVTNNIEVMVPPLGPFLKLFRWALFITSGIYDSLSTLPKIFAPYVWYNPLIHLAEYERFAFDPGYPTFYARLWYPALVLVGLLFFGLAGDRALARRGRGLNRMRLGRSPGSVAQA